MSFYYNQPKPESEGKKEKTERALKFAEEEVLRLEEAKKKQWNEIKDFVHSYEFTADGEQRIKKMTSEINSLKTSIKKYKKLLLDL